MCRRGGWSAGAIVLFLACSNANARHSDLAIPDTNPPSSGMCPCESCFDAHSRYAGLYTTDGALLPFSPTRQVALFLYSGGYTPGLFALALAQSLPSQLVDVGALGISISREQPRVEARVKVKSMLLGESSVVVKARLDVVSDIRLRETYESATVLGQNVAIPDFLQYSRELYVTYVDEDLLVVRDASGVPELLVRKEKDFTRNWGTEPTSVDDELAPGEELDAIM